MTTQPTTITGAVDQIAALLGTSGTPVVALVTAGVSKTYDHEPTSVAKGCSVTTCFAGMDPTEWLIAVRIYVADTDPRTAQRLLYTVIEAVDDALEGGQVIGPSEWTLGFDAEAGVHMAETIQRVGRDTF